MRVYIRARDLKPLSSPQLRIGQEGCRPGHRIGTGNGRQGWGPCRGEGHAPAVHPLGQRMVANTQGATRSEYQLGPCATGLGGTGRGRAGSGRGPDRVRFGPLGIVPKSVPQDLLCTFRMGDPEGGGWGGVCGLGPCRNSIRHHRIHTPLPPWLVRPIWTLSTAFADAERPKYKGFGDTHRRRCSGP